jgi:hypothetical protein
VEAASDDAYAGLAPCHVGDRQLHNPTAMRIATRKAMVVQSVASSRSRLEAPEPRD